MNGRYDHRSHAPSLVLQADVIGRFCLGPIVPMAATIGARRRRRFGGELIQIKNWLPLATIVLPSLFGDTSHVYRQCDDCWRHHFCVFALSIRSERVFIPILEFATSRYEPTPNNTTGFKSVTRYCFCIIGENTILLDEPIITV